jgi:SHS2 domain-containing protein
MDCFKKNPDVEINFLEHTADVGIEVFAADKKTALEAAACALLNLITDTSKVDQLKSLKIKLGPFTDDGDLLFEFLNEIIYLIDAKGMIFSSVEVESVEPVLVAVIKGEKFDPGKHQLFEQVKAATYHGMVFESTEKRWHLRVIFDV